MNVVLLVVSVLLIRVVLLQSGKAESAGNILMGGNEALFAFDAPDLEDPDIVYVRNNKTSIDYSIVRYEGSYGDFYDIHV